MSEKDNVAWSLLECIEKHEDCLKIKCNVFDTEFIVSRKGYENAICPTNFVFSRLIAWMQEEIEECDSASTLFSKHVWDINHPRAKELHYAIGEMIAVDNEPISVVERAGFERLMSKTSPHYKVPCRKYFTKTILPDMYSRVKEVVKTMLSTVKWMSLTSDVWSCRETRYSFISLTAHWIDDNFERKSAALNIKVFPGKHTGEAISDKLTEILAFWDIDKIKVHLLMRDNGGNMKKGCRLCDIVSESCTIHTLQLVIKGAIKSEEGVGILLKKCRKIATHIHKSSPSSIALAQIQVDLNIPIKKVKQDVATRWDSLFYLLERFLELENCLDLFAEMQEDNTNSKGLECAEWELLEELINLMKPFEEVTKSLSSNDSCISEVIPTIKALKFCLSKRKVSSTLISFKKSLETDLETRFQDLESNLNFAMATFLDPRFKAHLLSLNSLEHIKDCIQITLTEGGNVEQYTGTDLEIEGEADIIAEMRGDIASTNDGDIDMEDCLTELMLKATKNAKVVVTKEVLQAEIDLYINQPIIQKKSSPLEWWNKVKVMFPNVSQLVPLYLSAPSSSVYSERLFSESGNISDNKRKNLLSENLELLTFLHHNLPLINYNY